MIRKILTAFSLLLLTSGKPLEAYDETCFVIPDPYHPEISGAGDAYAYHKFKHLSLGEVSRVVAYGKTDTDFGGIYNRSRFLSLFLSAEADGVGVIGRCGTATQSGAPATFLLRQ